MFRGAIIGAQVGVMMILGSLTVSWIIRGVSFVFVPLVAALVLSSAYEAMRDVPQIRAERAAMEQTQRQRVSFQASPLVRDDKVAWITVEVKNGSDWGVLRVRPTCTFEVGARQGRDGKWTTDKRTIEFQPTLSWFLPRTTDTMMVMVPESDVFFRSSMKSDLTCTATFDVDVNPIGRQ